VTSKVKYITALTLPKYQETIVQDGRARDIGKDGLRHHTWPFREDALGFEDVIIVSDEDVPAPQLEGRSYTLWTEAHQDDQLYIAGQRSRQFTDLVLQEERLTSW